MSSEPFKNHFFYESLFENSSSIMLIIEPETGNILDANKAALKFYKYSKIELLNLNISQLNSLSSKQIKQEILDAKLEKRSYFNFRHKLKNGLKKL
jgi:PAS domain S-box-containing protein